MLAPAIINVIRANGSARRDLHQDPFRQVTLARCHFARPRPGDPAALTHGREQVRPGLERQRGEDVTAGQMMLEGGALDGRALSCRIAVKVAAKVAFAIPGDTVAQNEVMHPPAHVDGIHLNESVVSQRRAEAGRGRIEQQCPAVKSPGLEC